MENASGVRLLCIYLTLNQIENSASDQHWPQATSNAIYIRIDYKQPALATSDQQCYLYKRYCKRPAVLNRKQCKRPEMTTSDQQQLLFCMKLLSQI